MTFEEMYKRYKEHTHPQKNKGIKKELLEIKVRVNLSPRALNVLKSDMMSFEDEIADSAEKVITAERINNIVKGYYKKASASIYYSPERKNEEIKKFIGKSDSNRYAEQSLIKEELRLIKEAYRNLDKKIYRCS